MKMTTKLKSLLNNNELTIGSWLSLPSQETAEIMAQAGFPWIVIDLEHSVINYETMQSMLIAIENEGCIPLVRVSSNDPTQIKRVLDSGSHGIIVPMVNNANDAIKAVKAVKYPPKGNRGVGLARAQGYGLKFDSYYKSFNDSSIVICQIEHRDAVDNVEDIISVDGVDGIIIGPYDLSGSYGIPGKLNDKTIIDAEKKIINIANKKNVPSGLHLVHYDEKILKQKINQGFKFIVCGVDQLFLAKQSMECYGQIKKVLKEL